MSNPAAPRPVTVVTGGSRGIGRAIAERLAADGHDLVITYRVGAAEAEAVAASLRERGAAVLVVQADLEVAEDAARIIPAALQHFGRITGLVNNAGITGMIGDFLDVDPEESRAVFAINDLAPIILSKQAIAHMSTAEGGAGGAIVNISSGAATSGAPNTYIPYAMSKAALDALTIGLAKEFGPAGVRVNTVSPGTTHTEIHAAAGRPNAPAERAGGIPMRRAGEPHEVAGAVSYLLSDDASYTSGAIVRVTGGG
ncbi:SDR family NAD(P)-dependent oxidoreductase [Leifsonia sp. NPDC058292]|uniref:SDR family NAD(P)-dependent oxidoreductase n=1 Tax=Leifsonia sp. NPDC058292 TaxID=3346428 RepID=UPI0036DE08D1